MFSEFKELDEQMDAMMAYMDKMEKRTEEIQDNLKQLLVRSQIGWSATKSSQPFSMLSEWHNLRANEKDYFMHTTVKKN